MKTTITITDKMILDEVTKVQLTPSTITYSDGRVEFDIMDDFRSVRLALWNLTGSWFGTEVDVDDFLNGSMSVTIESEIGKQISFKHEKCFW